MGVGKYFKKKTPTPAPKATTSPPAHLVQEAKEDESSEGSESESQEQVLTLAGKASGNVTLGQGKVASQDAVGVLEDEAKETESEDSPFLDDTDVKQDDLSDFTPPTDKEIAAAMAKAKKPARGPARSLHEMSTAVRDTMSYDELKRARSKKTTLYRLMVTLDEFAAARHPLNQLPLVKKAGRLAEAYRFKHRSATKASDIARLDLMLEIDRLASAQVLNTYADLQYEARIMSTDLSQGEKNDRQDKDKKKGTGRAKKGTEVDQFQNLMGGSDIRSHHGSWGARPDEQFIYDPSTPNPQTAPNAKLASIAAGLSHAEILAIRTYTAENYKYMNPSMTGFDAGLEKHLDHKANDKSVDKLKQESAVHSSMAMRGLSKLPAWHGSAYRGDNMDLGRMQKMYTVGQISTNELFMSTSKGTNTGRQFLRTSGNGPIKLFVEVELAGNGGKDISMLSTASGEKEILIMPGAKYVTLSVEEYDIETFDRAPLRHRPDGKTRPDGKVPAYYVRIRQVG